MKDFETLNKFMFDWIQSKQKLTQKNSATDYVL